MKEEKKKNCMGMEDITATKRDYSKRINISQKPL